MWKSCLKVDGIDCVELLSKGRLIVSVELCKGRWDIFCGTLV